MKSSKGFTLVEILTALMAHTFFILMLGGTFYALLSFGNKSQQVLIAREHGRRVIDYVDSRIRNAGLGLQELESSKEIRDALKPLTKSSTPAGIFYTNKPLKIQLPVAVVWKDKDKDFTNNDLRDAQPKEPYNEIHSGNILTLLYAEREDDKDINLIIVSNDIQSVDVKNFSTEGGIFKFLKWQKNNYEDSDLVYDTKHKNIRNWAVLTASGVPFYTQPYNFGTSYGIILWTDADKDTKVYAGDELLYLRCERIFAENPRSTDDDTVRNLKVQKLKDTAWGDVTPFESGILEIYMELHKDTNILDFYVLSTGGRDNTMTHERPSEWPENARYKDDEYKNEVLYVSRASWKLNNLCEDFEWD